MINNSFLLQLLKSSGTITCRLNDTILPTIYALLNLDFALNQNSNSITIILFLEFVTYHNKHSDGGFLTLNVTIGDTKTISSMIFLAAYIVPTLVIFASNTTVHTILILILNSHILRTANTNPNIPNFTHLHVATNRTIICFNVLHRLSLTINAPMLALYLLYTSHTYCFSYKTMLIYAYYTNLISHDKASYAKCHSFQNDL